MPKAKSETKTKAKSKEVAPKKVAAKEPAKKKAAPKVEKPVVKPVKPAKPVVAKADLDAINVDKNKQSTGLTVADFGKEWGIQPKDFLRILKDLGVDVKTVSSIVSEEHVNLVRDLIRGEKEARQKAQAKAAAAAKPIEPAFIPKPVEPKVQRPQPVSTQKPAEVFSPKEPVKPVEPIKAPEPVAPPPPPPMEEVTIDTADIMVKDFADKINIKVSDLIKELMRKGILATINQRVNMEVAGEIAALFNKKLISTYQARKAESEGMEKMKTEEAATDVSKLKPRPPVVTIMGHVDHGKTKLLDAIRSTNVVATESGGITQHIGAYQVKINGKKVTFLDTPGHAAFTALRARGANVTDIVVLVVAADDGVMPQTIEALDHAKAAGVPIMVAINKIDKPEANPDRVKQQLSELGLTPEDWGGQTVMVPVSARQKTGIDSLLEMILLVAEVQELKANPEGPAQGVVVESRLEKGRGPVATVLVRSGNLEMGDSIAVGTTSGKVRALHNDLGENLKSAGPATPVELIGLGEVPAPGDVLQVFPNDRAAREKALQNKEALDSTKKGSILSLEDFSKEVKAGARKDLNLIVKADVNGSLEAIAHAISNLSTASVRMNIIHQGVGSINENDVVLAQASGAIVIGFHVEYEGNTAMLAEKAGINVRLYDIIYKITEDLQMAAEGMLEPVYEEVILGEAEVRATYRFSKVGMIAGSFVTSGKMVRGAKIRIFRGKDNTKVYEGKLENLKRFKDDAKEVETNFECGISIQGYEDFEVGDRIQAFEMRKKEK